MPPTSTSNSPELTEWVRESARKLVGVENVREIGAAAMGSEDFSFVLNEVPGAFYFLFATPEGIDPDTAAMNHSPLVLFDDEVLADQAASLATLAWEHNARPTPAPADRES